MSLIATSRALLAAALTVAAAGASPSPAPSKRITTMHEYALIFRSGGGLNLDDLARRNAAARDWALALRRAGTLHTASPLEEGGGVVSQQGVAPVAPDRAVASVLVIEAADLDGALALTKTHPGLAFGTEIEVRPVKAVAPPPAR